MPLRLLAVASALGIAATAAFADVVIEDPHESDPSQGYMLWIAAAGAAALCVLVAWRVVRKTGGQGLEAPDA